LSVKKALAHTLLTHTHNTHTEHTAHTHTRTHTHAHTRTHTPHLFKARRLSYERTRLSIKRALAHTLLTHTTHTYTEHTAHTHTYTHIHTHTRPHTYTHVHTRHTCPRLAGSHMSAHGCPLREH